MKVREKFYESTDAKDFGSRERRLGRAPIDNKRGVSRE